MKFLADQDVYASTLRYLSGLGHDVVTARQLGLAQADTPAPQGVKMVPLIHHLGLALLLSLGVHQRHPFRQTGAAVQ